MEPCLWIDSGTSCKPMTPPSPDIDWGRVKAVLGDVLDAPPEERANELDRRCGGDKGLRAAVAKLLAAHDDGADFLAEPTVQEPKPAPEPRPFPSQIGKYRIVREIGHGGMGTVYEAVQDKPRRKVAVKLLHASISSSRITERFVRESELLARIDHPNIARVFDAGTHEDRFGRIPYFAMEFIEDALPITRYAQEMSLSVRARVELFLPVCDAVHYGHQRGIIHRDLKPGNILVGGRDQRPRVIDFGVARTTGTDMSMVAMETVDHEIIGTLRYMSPEQCSGNANEVDVRCDVYALGVVLYETLMGRLPYDFKSTSLLEIPRVISEVPPRRLAPGHDNDLDTIVLKALEKSRERRYQSVSDLVGDLRRFLHGEPIEAKRDRKWYVMRKTIRRHRTVVGVAAGSVILLATAAVALGVLYTRAQRNAQILRRVSYFQSIALAEHALDSSRTDELRRLLEGCPPDLRGWEWWYLHGRTDESIATLEIEPFVAAALSPDGNLLASGGRGGVIEIWDVARREKVAEHSIGATYFETLSFSLDGSLLAIGSRSTTPSFVIDTKSGQPVLEIPSAAEIKSVLMHPDGVRLITGSAHGALTIRSVESGAVLQALTDADSPTQLITALGISPDGRSLAAGRHNGTIETWDLNSTELIFRVENAHNERISGLVFSPDGSRLYTSGWDAAVKSWDQAGHQIDVRLTQGDLVRGIALAPDSDLLAVVTTTTIELRNPSDGTLVRRVLGQTNSYGVAFMPESSGSDELVTWSASEAKIWNLQAPRGADVLGRHSSMSDSVATSPDGQWIASSGRGGRVMLWNAKTGVADNQWPTATSRVYRLEFSPNGERLAGACHDGTVRVWSVPGGELEHRFEGDRPVLQLQWSDDDVLLAASRDGLSAWSCDDDQRRWAVDAGQGGLASVACDPQGDRIATGGTDGTIKIWTLNSQKLLSVLSAHEGTVNELAWSPDGAVLASGGDDRVVRLWSADDGRMRNEFVGHSGLIKGIDFSPDGARLATSAWEGEIRLWETAGSTCVLRLRGHVGVVMDVEFTADGRRLVSAGSDGTVRVWEAPLKPPRR